MTGMISFKVDATGQPQVVSAANPLPVTFGASGEIIADGAVTTANPSYTNGTNRPLSLGLQGALRTQGQLPDATGWNGANPFVIGQRLQSGNVQVITGAGSSGGLYVTGDVLSGSTDNGSPVKIGGVFNSTAPTFTNGQRGDAQLDSRGDLKIVPCRNGVDMTVNSNLDATPPQAAALVEGFNMVFNGTTWDLQRGSAVDGAITKPYAFRASDQQFSSGFAGGGVTTMFVAPGAGIKNFCTGITISNATTADLSTNILAIIKNGAGTELWRAVVNAGLSLTATFPTPLQGDANGAMTLTLSSTTGGGVVCNVAAQGYKS